MADDKHKEKLTEADSHKQGCVTKCTDSYLKTGETKATKSRPALPHSYRYNGHQYIMAGKGKGCKCCGEKGTKAQADIYNIDFKTEGAARRRLDRVLGKTMPTEAQHGKSVVKKGVRKAVKAKPNDPRADREAWYLDTTNNFIFGYLPWNHDYHHMVPWEALDSVFSEDELDLLQAATYNLNSGENMIILPKSEKIGQAMLLPTHTDNHPGFTEEVIAHLDQIRASIEKKKEGHKLTKKNLATVKKKIVNLEKNIWPEIVAFGKLEGEAGADVGGVGLLNVGS